MYENWAGKENIELYQQKQQYQSNTIKSVRAELHDHFIPVKKTNVVKILRTSNFECVLVSRTQLVSSRVYQVMVIACSYKYIEGCSA